MVTETRKSFDGHIAAYDPEDLGTIQSFWVASWTLTMPEIDFEARRQWLATHLESLEAEGTEIRVAHVGGERVGFVTTDPANGHMDQICVAPDWLGRGVAEALLHAARAISPGRLMLDVNTDNARAIRFYEREGFVKTDTSVNPRSGLPVIRMVWTPR